MEKAIHSSTDTVAAEHLKAQDPNSPKSVNDMTEEEQTKELDRMLVMAQFMPTMDPWGQEVLDTLGGSLVKDSFHRCSNFNSNDSLYKKRCHDTS
jgi:hypothetical protein